ncbi:BRCT domain-containing protein [Aliivibrio fischeri]|uniref:BRCT domain-containing protein n=1 Tax=Aliivibrio fischeri TaxID=668 RepID=UPI0007C44998|nr:BRCT domain-containing protein [Aliivibrio fischeri]MBP3142254.1 BRCT domain-containing protein [Aliivibrio fischeri]MBP3157119.1 BRCT domain-containing protein [Aliivibrio fischeri]MCE7575188.1 BRCT domain-containing protein [Aliivibrio fischeri]
MTNLDQHGQPINTNFCHHKNKIKALLALRGILQGVTADTKLNDTEVLFLDVWLKNDDTIKSDGDFLDLKDIIEDVLEDGIIEQHELNEIQEVMNDVIQYGYKDIWDIDALTNQLLGFLQGITSDDNLNDKEIIKLTNLLNENNEVTEKWPGNVIKTRLNNILADGIIDEEERADLLLMLKGICGQQFTDTGLAECAATDCFSKDIIIDSIENKHICFTGKFMSGNRKTIESIAKKHKASTRKDVVQALDYLVIGSMASRDWKFTSHGRKIEAALFNQQKGLPVQIITEETWVKYIK